MCCVNLVTNKRTQEEKIYAVDHVMKKRMRASDAIWREENLIVRELTLGSDLYSIPSSSLPLGLQKLTSFSEPQFPLLWKQEESPPSRSIVGMKLCVSWPHLSASHVANTQQMLLNDSRYFYNFSVPNFCICGAIYVSNSDLFHCDLWVAQGKSFVFFWSTAVINTPPRTKI